MHTCIVCTNSSPRTKDKPYVTYHSIPSNPQRRKKWIRSLKIKNLLDWHRVCSYHFTDDDYILQRGFKRTLRKSAIPSSEIVVTQDSNTKPEFIARLRRSLTVMSELVYPEDPRKSRNRRFFKQTIRQAQQTVENIEVQRVENSEVHDVEKTLENNEVYAVEQTVENTELHAVEQTVNNTELLTVEQSVEISEVQTNTEVTTENQIVNKAEITPRRSTRKIKVKKNDDEIESNSFAQSKRKIFTQNNSGDQTSSTSGDQKPKNYYRMGQGIKCYVKTCTNRYSKSGLSFFGFPNDADVRERWIKNCGLSPGEIKPLGKLKSTIRICKNHFEDSMFLNPNKPKRLKPDAVPTIFNNDDKGDTSESTHSNHENINVVTIPYTIFNGMESEINTMNNTDDHAPDDMNNVLITNDNMGVNNLHNYCSIPDCNINEYTKDIGSETLYRPDNETMANNWSRIYGVKLTVNSAVCSRHFGATDTNDSDIPLDSNYKSKTLKTYKSASKRLKTNNGTDDLTVKKSKNNSFSNESKTTANYENKDIEYINNSTSLSNRKLNDSFLNTPAISSDAHASFDNVLPKTADNDFVPMSLKGKCTIEYYSGAGTPIIIHSPEDDENDPGPRNVSSDDSIPISLQSQFKKIISKSQPKNYVSDNFEKNFIPDKNSTYKVLPTDPNDHVYFGELQPSIIQIARVSAIDSTKTINVEESYNSVAVKPEPFDEFIPSTSTDDVLSDSCEPNFYKSPPLASIEDSVLRTQESNFQTTTEQTPMTGLGIYVKPEPIDAMDDEDENTLTEDNLLDNLQSNAESPHSTSIRNSISKMIQKEMDELQKDVGESRKSTPTSSKLRHILLNTPSNSSLSITVHSGHQSNNSNTSQSTYCQKSQQSAANSEVVDQLCSIPSVGHVEFNNKCESTMKPTFSNKKRLASNNKSLIPPVVINYVSSNSNKNGANQNNNIELNQVNLLIHEMTKTIKLPNNYWRHYFNIRSYSTRFIEFIESMKLVKKITFNKSLVPDIYVNGKSFEFCEEIRTADQLENLLNKVDQIEICFGYGGLHHEKCIAYFDDTSEETLMCHNCRILMSGTNMSSEEAIIQTKSNLVKELHNQIFEMRARVLQAKKKKYIQRQKRDDLENILQVINPFKVLKTLKPPAYIN